MCNAPHLSEELKLGGETAYLDDFVAVDASAGGLGQESERGIDQPVGSSLAHLWFLFGVHELRDCEAAASSSGLYRSGLPSFTFEKLDPRGFETN